MVSPPRQTHGTTMKPSRLFPPNEVMTPQTVGRHVVRLIMTLLLAALSDRVCKLSLSPIYGSIPSELDITKSLVPLVVLWSTVSGYWWTRFSVPISLLGYLPPLILPVLARSSGRLGPYWGPRVAYVFTSFPIFFRSLTGNVAFCMEIAFQDPRTISVLERQSLRWAIKNSFIVVLSYAFVHVFRGLERTATILLSSVMMSTAGILTSRYMMQALIAGLWASLARSRWTASLGMLPLFHILFFNPHVPLAHNTAIVNATLQTAGWSLVARQESLTGYVSVLDNVKDGFRVMRCDHSLLGGEWRNKPEGHPARFNEPIYSIFVMLEAVRLVESRSKKATKSTDKNALVM